MYRITEPYAMYRTQKALCGQHGRRGYTSLDGVKTAVLEWEAEA